MATTADYAAAYVRKYGLALVPLPPKTKRPLKKDWGLKDCLTTPEAARQYYERNPSWNIGVALGPSGLVTFDVDNVEAMQILCDEFGWDLETLRQQVPTVQGKAPNYRMLFRVPEGMEFHRKSIAWPNKLDPDGTIHSSIIEKAIAAEAAGDLQEGKRIRDIEAEPYRRITVFEIRGAVDEQVQDVLPPSIHPKTDQPYIWLTKPNGAIPEPPAWLLAVWKNWDALKPQLQGLCPWAVQRPTPKPPKTRRPANDTTPSVIDAYDQENSIESALTRYGYRPQGKRWLSPHSSTGLAGVVIFDGKAWVHHASDPLCSDESGQLVGAFDLFRYYEHGGDISKAVKAAAESLGMKLPPRARVAQSAVRAIAAPVAAVSRQETPLAAGNGEVIDSATGEITAITDPLPDEYRGRPLGTVENLTEICRRLGVIVRYNVISKEEELLIPNQAFSLDNRANASLAWLMSWCERLRMPTGKVGDYVTYMADQNLHNPVANWITSQPWDGQSRLQDLYDTVAAEGDENLKNTILRRWLISAVAAAFNPEGVSAHGVLVFQGAQYMGKTAWFKRLVPPELRHVLQDGMMLRADDRDSVKQIVSHWIVELGELDATFRKSDIAQLKAFLTRDKDILRRAYARRESEFARRTVFFASVNPKEFLHDQTGNRRFWVIECKSLEYDHGINMQQLWAEVLTLYRAGEPWVLQAEEHQTLEENNKSYEVIDPIEELIASGLRWNEPPAAWRWRSATEVLIELGRDTCSQAEATRAAHLIRQRNGGMSRKTNGGRTLLAPEPWGSRNRP
jgi:hypothetical protein